MKPMQMQYIVFTSLVIAVSSKSMKDVLCPMADVVFAIDTSESIGQDELSAVKKYCSALIGQFSIGSGESDAQFGLVVFHDEVVTQWALNKHGTMVELKHHMEGIPYEVGTTDLHLALTTSLAILKGAGSRPSACKAVILFTDAWYDLSPLPTAVADEIRASPLNGKVITVGVKGINGQMTKEFNRTNLVKLSKDEAMVFSM